MYFLQTPKQVWTIWERDHFVRRIYLTDKHSENVKPSWFGESIGHYEGGDTLVVDTIGLAAGKYHYIDSFRTPPPSSVTGAPLPCPLMTRAERTDAEMPTTQIDCPGAPRCTHPPSCTSDRARESVHLIAYSISVCISFTPALGLPLPVHRSIP